MKKYIVAILIFIAANLALATPHTLEELKDTYVKLPIIGQRERTVTQLIMGNIVSSHYSRPRITALTSSRWFENYFETLDRSKMYFTQQDIQVLRRYEALLCNRRSADLSLEFALSAYRIFMERVKERIFFTADYFAQTPDFTIDESVSFDAKSLNWAADETELHDRWRRQAKSQLLSDIIDQEERSESEEEVSTEGEGAPKKRDIRQRILRQMIDNFYLRQDFNSLEVLEPFFNAFCTLFDPHTTYMAPETNEEFNIAISLSLQGIGATLSYQDNYVTIVGLVPGSPAERSGLLNEGDRIIAVAQGDEDFVSILDMPLNRAVKLIRGPKGSKVRLTILPKKSNREIEVSLIRDEIQLDDRGALGKCQTIPVAGDAVANILTIHLPSFYRDFQSQMEGKKDFRSTTGDVAKLIKEEMAKQPIDGIILDLRSNGGGSLDEAVDLPGLFVDSDMPIVQVRDGKSVNCYRTTPQALMPDQPLIVLTDSSSASASEIVAAFLQDSQRGLVIGDKSTHGKGTVQTITPVEPPKLPWMKNIKNEDNGSMKITIQKFYRISGGSTQLRGVVPDIVIPSPYDYLESKEEFLPNVMEWDNIPPLEYNCYQGGWRDHLPELKKAADDFMANDERFINYVAFINDFAEYQKIKEIPLEIGKYRDFVKKENDMTKKLKEIMPGSDSRSKKEAVDNEERDAILNAAFAVMAKMLQYK